MQYFTLYTPATPFAGRMDAENIAKMNELTESMTSAGVLVTNGALMSRNTGMKVVRKNGNITISDGPVSGSTLMPAAGYALLRADTREELVKHVKDFLEVAGDGTTEIIQVMDPPAKD